MSARTFSVSSGTDTSTFFRELEAKEESELEKTPSPRLFKLKPRAPTSKSGLIMSDSSISSSMRASTALRLPIDSKPTEPRIHIFYRSRSKDQYKRVVSVSRAACFKYCNALKTQLEGQEGTFIQYTDPGSDFETYQLVFGYLSRLHASNGETGSGPYMGVMPTLTYMQIRKIATELEFTVCIDICNKRIESHLAGDIAQNELYMILDDPPMGITDWDAVVEYIAEHIFLRPQQIFAYKKLLKEYDDLEKDVNKLLDEKKRTQPKTTLDQLAGAD